MGELAVAVVGARHPGNVGTIARAMKNFGLSDLLLVDPPPIEPDDEAHGFAGHAREDVLPDREVVTLDHLVANFHTVGFTAITGENDRRHVRYPFATPAELADDLAGLDADVALVFGREGTGLDNDELARFDRICSIPASAEYPVLNLGQAATVALYELRDIATDRVQHPENVHNRAAESEIEGLHEAFGGLVDAIDHPEEKCAKATRLFRRLVGRAHPTGREVSTLRGIVRRARVRAERAEPTDGESRADRE